MGFGNFLKRLTLSPIKGTKQALKGNIKGSLRTAFTGDRTAPFYRAAPFFGGGGPERPPNLEQRLLATMQQQQAPAPAPAAPPPSMPPPMMGPRVSPILDEVQRARRAFDMSRSLGPPME